MRKSTSRASTWSATADRIEIIIDCLTNSHIVSINHGAAARTVEYCRRRAAGGKENINAEREMIDFLRAHNQSLDWAWFGDVSGMIARLADGTSSRQRPHLLLV
jgi:hypothetical protein